MKNIFVAHFYNSSKLMHSNKLEGRNLQVLPVGFLPY